MMEETSESLLQPMEFLQPIEAIQPINLLREHDMALETTYEAPSTTNVAQSAQQSAQQPSQQAGDRKSIQSTRSSPESPERPLSSRQEPVSPNPAQTSIARLSIRRDEPRTTSVRIDSGEGTEAGCYLTFDTVSEGTLFLNWSETHVEGAVAFFRPGKPVAKFKYKQNGGKSELIRNLRGGTGKGMKRYYQGWSQFVKMARDNQADLIVWNTRSDVSMYYLDKGNYVCPLETNSFIASSLIFAIAVIPPGNSIFEGVNTMTRDYFAGTGNREGAALLFN